MKKTYKNPQIEVVMIQTQLMLAASPGAHVLDPGTTPISDSSDIGGHYDEYDW